MPKIRLHVLTTYNSPNSLALSYPLLINKAFFKAKGIDIHFYDRITNKVHDCDVIFINGKFFRTWHAEREKELYNIIAGFKKKTAKVFWFDTTDSTGTTQFNVMPYVDGYYKNQVLKDRSLYQKVYYGYRIFTEFYKENFGVSDVTESHPDKAERNKSVATPLQREHMHKLHISWNTAMNDWGSYNFLSGGLIAKIRTYLPFNTSYTAQFIKADKTRKIDVNGRIGLSHSRDTIKFHRETIVNMLKKFKIDTSRTSRRQYLNEIRNSKIGISPFGWGEICYRDFELIINGALLFKADMSHLKTWPPLYIKDQTYVPYSWSLEDFEQKLRDILKDKEKIIRVSKKAQELYAYYLYGNGRLEFCNRVLDIIR